MPRPANRNEVAKRSLEGWTQGIAPDPATQARKPATIGLAGMNTTLTKKCVAEFVGTFTLIFIGVGAIYNNPGLLGVALAHGLAIAVMVSATGGISGGHLNPAVTFGLLVGGKIKPAHAMAYWVAQLAGGAAAGFLLVGVFGARGKGVVATGAPGLVGGT